MKSRLIKFACHHCGTKLAVPPEMAGVTDQCPKCGTTITAPPESTVEPVRKKTKFGPVPASPTPPPYEPHGGPEMQALPGWSASELADALKPPAPLPSYVPLAQSEPQPPLQTPSGLPHHGLLPDPPAIPDPGPLFVPKRQAYGEGVVAVAAPPEPAPPVVTAPKSEHPVLGSILNALSPPKARATTTTATTPGESLAPDPLAPPVSGEPAPIPAPAAEAPALPASAPLPWETPAAPSPFSSPPLEAPPSLTGTPAPEAAPTVPTEAPGSEAPSPAETTPASEQTVPPQEKTPAAPASPVSTTPIALVPESLPDPRAVEEAAMPGMGEMLAGEQIAQDQPAPPDTRDHRPLLHVPFLPVAESPVKGRRTQKRKVYIVAIALFLVFDVIVGILLLNAPPGALSGGSEPSDNGNTTAKTPSPPVAPATGAPGAEAGLTSTATPPAKAPTSGGPSDVAAAQPAPSSSDSSKPKTPPMAIPLPGHSSTDVPTATPVPATEATTTTSKPETAVASPSPADATPSSTAPSPSSSNPASTKGPEAATTENAPKTSAPTAAPPSVTPEPSPAPAPSTSMTNAVTAAPAPAPVSPATPAPAVVNKTPTSVATLMGPQPNSSSMMSVDGDPPWLKRISPSFPAIDGTPLLPSAVPQAVSPPPPLPPPPSNAEGMAGPPVAATTNVPPSPSTPTPDSPATTTTPAATPPPTPAPAPESASNVVGKVPEEAASALEVLRNFLAAPTWQERANYVQKPDTVKPAMEKHAAKYGDGPMKVGAIKFVDRHPGRDGGPPYCMFEIEGGDLKHEVLVLIEQPTQGQPRIDWSTFVEFKDDLLLKFLETKGEPNQSFRVLLSRKHYFAKDVPDLASKDSFQVQQPNDRFDGHVFLPKSTALSKKLATQLGWNQNMPAIVELAWRTNGKFHWVEIVRVVSYGWRG